MAIFCNFRGGRGDGRNLYSGKRSPDSPSPWGFFYSVSYSEHAENPGYLPQASLYKYAGTLTKEGNDTIWDFDFFDYVTPADAHRWMIDHVSEDEAEW